MFSIRSFALVVLAMVAFGPSTSHAQKYWASKPTTIKVSKWNTPIGPILYGSAGAKGPAGAPSGGKSSMGTTGANKLAPSAVRLALKKLTHIENTKDVLVMSENDYVKRDGRELLTLTPTTTAELTDIFRAGTVALSQVGYKKSFAASQTNSNKNILKALRAHDGKELPPFRGYQSYIVSKTDRTSKAVGELRGVIKDFKAVSRAVLDHHE